MRNYLIIKYSCRVGVTFVRRGLAAVEEKVNRPDGQFRGLMGRRFKMYDNQVSIY